MSKFVVYATIIYNKAIAATNTALIENAVIILFVMEIDEQIFELIDNHYPSWIDKVTKRNENEENEDAVKQVTGKKEEEEEEKEEEKEETGLTV